MNPISLSLLHSYWSQEDVAVNLIVFANLFGALLLGLIVGYERSYHGRAAGMRTYGLVCMAACALTVITGYPGFWFGQGIMGNPGFTPDPTRVIQGIVTGVGFLGAGVIMREGMNISGLTTAASIWSSSAIGVLVGVGFYSAAILLALLSAGLMMWAQKLEAILPSHPAVSMTLRFRPGFMPNEEALVRAARNRGYAIATGTFQMRLIRGCHEWHCVAISIDRRNSVPLSAIAEELGHAEGIEEFQLAHARN